MRPENQASCYVVAAWIPLTEHRSRMRHVLNLVVDLFEVIDWETKMPVLLPAADSPGEATLSIKVINVSHILLGVRWQ